MHGNIYEISQYAIDIEDQVSEDELFDENIMEYVIEHNEDDRNQAIDMMLNSQWFSSLFKAGSDKNTIVFMGGVSNLIEQWHQSIQKELNKMIDQRSTNTWGIREAINCPFRTTDLFCLPDYSGVQAVPQRTFVEWLETLEPGTELCINAVFDYKF